MNPLAVIIPSKTASNLIECVAAVKKNETDPGVRIVIIDDFPLGERPNIDGVEWVTGIKPFVFPRNINLGIAQCGNGEDVVLLNDDAILQTVKGFTILQTALEYHQAFGVLSANVDGVISNKPGTGIVEAGYMVPFVCVLIPRRTINAVGVLDERFVEYGYDDDDYCLRVRQAGLKIGRYAGCRVDHSSLKSTYRRETNRPPGLAVNRQIFIAKWGQHPL